MVCNTIDKVRHIFVYGSLISAYTMQEELGISDQLRWVQAFCIQGSLYHLGEYPGAVLENEGGLIQGELYEILEEDCLKILDQYEGFDSLKQRQSLFIRQVIRDYSVPFYIYVYNQSVKTVPCIEDGDWVKANRQI